MTRVNYWAVAYYEAIRTVAHAFLSQLLKFACSGPGECRTRDLSVIGPKSYSLQSIDHCTDRQEFAVPVSDSRQRWQLWSNYRSTTRETDVNGKKYSV